MLCINTQQNQTIDIDGKYRLRVVVFEESKLVVELDGKDTLTIPPGKHFEIVPEVSLTYRGQGWSGYYYAILGFTAPRHISILGTWKKDKKPGNPDFQSMTDKSLVYYATLNWKTELEKELFKRLRNKL